MKNHLANWFDNLSEEGKIEFVVFVVWPLMGIIFIGSILLMSVVLKK